MVSKPTRRAPLINRGYYSRVKFIRKAMAQFFERSAEIGANPQVVCLGAGLDTAWWCLKQQGTAPSGGWFEVDFKEVILDSKCLDFSSPSHPFLFSLPRPFLITLFLTFPLHFASPCNLMNLMNPISHPPFPIILSRWWIESGRLCRATRPSTRN